VRRCSRMTVDGQLFTRFRLHLHIRHYDLGDYVDFLDQIRQHMSGSLSSTDSCLFGNVAVDMYPHPEGNKGDYRTVDLLPVIKRCRDAKNLRICCGTNDCKRRMCELDIWACVEKTPNRVFNVKTNAKLAACLDDAVSALELSFPPYLEFCIYKRNWQEWVGATSLTAQCRLDAQVWCKELGVNLGKYIGSVWFSCCDVAAEEAP